MYTLSVAWPPTPGIQTQAHTNISKKSSCSHELAQSRILSYPSLGSVQHQILNFKEVILGFSGLHYESFINPRGEKSTQGRFPIKMHIH